MYYGPNYDASSTGVSSPVSPNVSSPVVMTPSVSLPVSVSPSVPSPVYPLPDPNDKESCESNEPHDDHVKCHNHGDDFDHANDLDCDHSDGHDHFDDPDQDDLDNGDDDDEWITPFNLHRAREQMGGATTVSAKSVTVGCLTTDFSIQVHKIYHDYNS